MIMYEGLCGDNMLVCAFLSPDMGQMGRQLRSLKVGGLCLLTVTPSAWFWKISWSDLPDDCISSSSIWTGSSEGASVQTDTRWTVTYSPKVRLSRFIPLILSCLFLLLWLGAPLSSFLFFFSFFLSFHFCHLFSPPLTLSQPNFLPSSRPSVFLILHSHPNTVVFKGYAVVHYTTKLEGGSRIRETIE